MEIIEKVRIVTFTGTKEQVDRQEGSSRPFGILNPMRDIEKACQVTVEDATGINLDEKPPFEFTYTNYKGETSKRRVIPIQPRFEVNEFHGDKPLWLLKAYDLDKGVIKYFDMSEIRS